MMRSTDERPSAIVVGSGAGGGAVTRELQGSYDVTVLEAGGGFRPLSLSMGALEHLRSVSPRIGPRLIPAAFPPMRLRHTDEGMLLVNGRAVGGSTLLSTGNALRGEDPLSRIGVRLDREIEEIEAELGVNTAHERGWRPSTRRLFDACARAGLDPRPMPKMVDARRCRRCGRCVLGCPSGAKWDSRRLLDEALAAGARLRTGCTVERIDVQGERAAAVMVRVGLRRVRLEADLIVLCAGGLGTPPILERSGIRCEPRLFVDPVLVVAAPIPGARQQAEIPMPFYCKRADYIISPYFDYLSYLFDRRWHYPADGILALMIKLADTAGGSVPAQRGAVDKRLSAVDRQRLAEAEELCRRILTDCGADPEQIFLGTLNAGHPGGMLPLGPQDAHSLHPDRLPSNLYVADASLLPESIGGPPILTILALARRVARCAASAQGRQMNADTTAPRAEARRN